MVTAGIVGDSEFGAGKTDSLLVITLLVMTLLVMTLLVFW
jgi:hypothetical protein